MFGHYIKQLPRLTALCVPSIGLHQGYLRHAWVGIVAMAAGRAVMLEAEGTQQPSKSRKLTVRAGESRS